MKRSNLVFVKRSGEAGVPGKPGLGLLGWEADLRAQPPVTSAGRFQPGQPSQAVWSAATQ